MLLLRRIFRCPVARRSLQDLLAERLALSKSLPDFGDCPYFEGSDHLPTEWYRDVSAPVSLAALRNASLRRIKTSGTAKLTATETCANIPSHCAEGITYNATASVSTSVTFVLVRVRP